MFCKILVIAAAVYTLALGAPVKRDTSVNTVAKVCSAAKDLQRLAKNLAMCSFTQNWTLPIWATPTGSSDEGSAARDLLKKLTKDHPFNGAVSGAVLKCFNYSERSRHKCKLAAAAITLYDTTKDFITTYQDLTHAQEIQIEIDWNTTRYDVMDKVIQTLCPASAYILNLLKVIDYGRYCNVCHESLCGAEQ